MIELCSRLQEGWFLLCAKLFLIFPCVSHVIVAFPQYMKFSLISQIQSPRRTAKRHTCGRVLETREA